MTTSVGDIVIGRRGEMGRCAVVTSIEDGWLCGTGSMIIRVKGTSDVSFLQRVLSSSPVIIAIENASVGSTMINLNQSTLRELSIAVPYRKKEQTAIANALSDIDTLISEQEKLIAKKQAIKTATMQQLLTGRTRLPQFALREDGSMKGYKQSELGEVPEDWVVLTLGDCTHKVGSGKTPTGGSNVYIDSGRAFIRSQNVGWGGLDLSEVAFISEGLHKTFPGSELKSNDVLLNITGASIGRCAKANRVILGGNVNQHVCIIRLDEMKFNPMLLVELMNSTNGQSQIDSYQAGGNREGLNFVQVRSIQFPVSSSTAEQEAIAKFLMDKDDDLSLLTLRLAKTRQIKQGMMQELLTGKTRLVKPEKPQ